MPDYAVWSMASDAEVLDTEQAAVVDSAGTTSPQFSLRCGVRRANHQYEERSDGNASPHLRLHRAPTRAYRQRSRREICALVEVDAQAA